MNNSKFIFRFALFEQNLDEINKLDPKKASQTTDIPFPIIKGNKDAIALFFIIIPTILCQVFLFQLV